MCVARVGGQRGSGQAADPHSEEHAFQGARGDHNAKSIRGDPLNIGAGGRLGGHNPRWDAGQPARAAEEIFMRAVGLRAISGLPTFRFVVSSFHSPTADTVFGKSIRGERFDAGGGGRLAPRTGRR